MRSGKFCLKDLPYLALDIQDTTKWNVIRTELGVPGGELSGINDDYERCYMMLKTWLVQYGEEASYEKLAGVLQKLELSAIRTNYCLKGNHPPSQETAGTHTCKLSVCSRQNEFECPLWFVEINRYGLFMGRRQKRPPVTRFISRSLMCGTLYF